MPSTPETPAPRRDRNDFIRDIINADLAAGRHTRVATRFPPEPNGYLHIGHAKSICLNFGIALEYGGTCNLRYDDTNPTKEDVEYVESIERDVRWLGFAPTQVLYASSYFETMYEIAERLIREGKAYVCSLSEEEIRAYRGTLSEPGRESPHRSRGVDENLALFRRMRAGEFPDGAHVLRARIDMASANMKMRDPLLYRIRHAHHHVTGDAWCLYPMYDYAHPLSDAIEGITHSICTLEFENNRELYDWVIDNSGLPARPRQYEFARLNLDYTVMSKRKLLQLVQQKVVTGWDDPRMPTIAGMRRRGYRPEAIRAFAELIGVSKHNSTVDVGKLEYCVRDDLNRVAPRAMAVLRPLKVVLTNVAEGEVETVTAPFFPPDVDRGGADAGARQVPLCRELWIERDDFREHPEPGYQRLAPGRTVRLRYAGAIACDEVVRDAAGTVTELRCTLLGETRGGGNPADGRKVWGVIHWVSARHAVPAEVRLYDRLCAVPRPEDDGGDFLANLNPGSLEVVTAFLEPALGQAEAGSRWQFERLGYFVVDTVDTKPGALVWNRIVTLRDAWADQKTEARPAPKTKAATEGDKGADKKSAKARTRPAKRSGAEYRAEARARDPELAAAHDRLLGAGLGAQEADVLSGDRATVSFYDEVVAAGVAPATAARWLVHELPRAAGERGPGELPLRPAALARLASLVDGGTVTAAAGKEILAQLCESGGDPDAIVAARGLQQVDDDAALEGLVAEVLDKNPGKVAEYKGGRTGLLGFFVGQVVKASGGKANPQKVGALLSKRLA
jgi:glutaminyl-tRNA synthetase